MASNGVDAVTGAKKFPEGDALAIGADLEEVSAQAVAVGTRLIGTTAQRGAYAFARKGLRWFDTTLDREFMHSGSGWVASLSANHQANPGIALTGISIPQTAVGLPGGVIFKSGLVVSGTTVSAEFGNEYMPAIGFSPEFPTACLHVAITQIQTGAAVAATRFAVDVISKSQFRVFYPGGTSPTTRAFAWMAIGY